MPNSSAANVVQRRPPRRAGVGEPFAAWPSGRSQHPVSIRTRALVRRLADARDKPLVIVVAPPGYGKSTLVAEWARADDRPFLWASGVSGWSELARLVRSARRRHSSYVVVLESADELEPDRLSDIVLAALNELPVDSTIAVVSRSEPQLPLGRLRAHGMLAEVRMGDLALSAAESEGLLRSEGLELPTQEAQALVLRTEGWPAALHLAALCLRDEPLEAASFSGRQHLVSEYISEEVLAYLPPGLRRFATRTSVLEELCGPGCDAVLEEHGSGLRLAELAALSPLMAPVDSDHHRYRWHPLVREALRSTLQRSEPEQEPALHRRASLWYARGADTRRAIDHAAAAGDAALAGDLLFENVVSYLSRGRHEMVERWLTALGDERVASYAPLALSAALCCLVAGNGGEAKRWSISAMATAKRGHAGKNLRSLSIGLAAIRALTPSVRLEAMGELAASAQSADAADSQWQPVLFWLRGVAAHLRGELCAAAETLDEGASLASDAAPMFTALCLAQRGMIAIEQRDWEMVAETTDRSMMILEEWGLTKEPIAALVLAAAAASRAHHGRIDEAKRDVRGGMNLLAGLGEFVPWYGAEARILLAHASLWLAGIVRARTLLAEASRLARKTPDAVIFAHWFDEAWAYVDTLAEAKLAGPSALTIAELRVLRFLPSHRSFREIADQLEVSANTVKTQAHAVYRKLGVASRSEAVARAHDSGLLG